MQSRPSRERLGAFGQMDIMGPAHIDLGQFHADIAIHKREIVDNK
jgi:hypothetical protein